MFDLSVLICSHNPRADFLRRTLHALKEQNLPLENWELLLVDNASAQPLAAAWDLSWHPHARHISESELGMSAARQRGMREAASDLLIFIDDDNVLDVNYLTRAREIKEGWPSLGVWGSGSIIPEYELQPGADVGELIPYLAIRQTKRTFWSNVFPCLEATPWGAGMCVRAKVADAYRRIIKESTILISGRRGDVLLSGEDVETSWVACHIGLGMGVFPELKLTHLIAAKRVSPEYLVKLYEGTTISDALLVYKWTGVAPNSPYRPLNLLSSLKNLIVRRGFDRRIYYAKVRALAAARRIIRSSQLGRDRRG
jgi:glycosyltransferase involved in cell wall biosynthesis